MAGGGAVMAGAWFESVAEAQRRAKKRLPASVYMAIWAGTEHGLTLKDNVEAFGELGLAPHVADLPRERNLATTVMGQEIALPVIISPTGVQAVHPDGEVAVARAAAARGTAIGLSSFASQAGRGGRGGQPADVLPGLLGGLARADPRAGGAGPHGWRGRADRHARLVVLAWPRLGQSDDPRQLDFRAMVRWRRGVLRPRVARWTGRAPAAART